VHGKRRIVEEGGVYGDGVESFSWISAAIADQGEINDDLALAEIGGEDEERYLPNIGEMRLDEEEAEEPLESLPAQSENDDEEIPDVDGFDGSDNVVVIDDPSEFRPTANANTNTSDNILRTHTFDLSITYDKYYQTPRVWLAGYAEDGCTALPPARLLDQHISAEHARRTVTIETHPALGLVQASIHPCRHAHVMKRIVGVMREGGRREVRVDQYLVIFLKFISTVLPHIDYDHTMSLD